MEKISTFGNVATDILLNEFGIAPQESRIKLYNLLQWEQFSRLRRLDNSIEGIYSPRECTAHILRDTEFFIPNLFHEYFGHGLYIEYSRQGQEIKTLENSLLLEEQNAGIRTHKELLYFRENNNNYNKLMEYRHNGWTLHEGFAMWMEWYLSKLTDNGATFSKKFESLRPTEKEVCNKFIEYSINYGNHALFFSLDLPKLYNKEILNTLLRNLFKGKSDSIKLCLVYGSRKPYSDIDLFIVSDEIPTTNLGWLDLYSVDSQKFEDSLNRKDIAVTDPLFTGEFILGDRDYLEQTRQKVINSPITLETIYFQKEQAKKAIELASKFPKSSGEYINAMSYYNSYLTNAIAFESGKMPLTLRNLISAYPQSFNELVNCDTKVQLI